LELAQIQDRVKKTLKKYKFGIVNEYLTDNKFRIIADFGQEIEYSTFFIEQTLNNNSIVIGANITLGVKVLTKSLSHKIQLIATTHNVSCSPITYNANDENGTLSLQIAYNFLRYSELNFILYVNNFKRCVHDLYADIKKYLQYQDATYLDLSMFENADWAIFDPYTLIIERDKKYNGSWDLYIKTIKKMLKKDKIELKHIEMCKKFEAINNIPLDFVCDYIVEQIMKQIENIGNKKTIS
jgi:hypothetical protein